MTAAAPEGMPPRHFNYLPTPSQASQEALLRMAVVPSHFSWSGCELPFMPVSKKPKIRVLILSDSMAVYHAAFRHGVIQKIFLKIFFRESDFVAPFEK
jgi:hypothetical protein